MTVLIAEQPSCNTIYSAEDLEMIDLNRVPKHVAIIMDGNRRWAQQNGVSSLLGHYKGAEVVIDAVRAGIELGIKTITVYAFSTENWGRPAHEVHYLMDLFALFLEQNREMMVRDGVRFHTIGNIEALPEKVLHSIEETKKVTQASDRIQFVLAINYGGRDEIRRAMMKILEEKIPSDQLTEECIAKHLDTHLFSDPELLIRTSGEKRVSNFLLWQISYSEIYSTDVLWPNFSPLELLKAVSAFQRRSRRLGE